MLAFLVFRISESESEGLHPPFAFCLRMQASLVSLLVKQVCSGGRFGSSPPTASYPLGALYRYGLHPSRTSLTARHVFSTSLGILFGLLCFGWSQMFLLFFMTGVCYAMLLWLPTTVVHLYTVVFAMVCVSMGHVYRLTDYEGPACTMKEYLNFVDGSNFTTKTSNRNGSDVKALTRLLSSHKDLLAHIIMFHVRSRYYFVWLLVESINNFIGLGSVVTTRKANHYLVTVPLQFGTNFRSVITGWNVTTSLWLSKMRRLLWNHFQTSETWRRIYDVATWATSHTLLNYGAMCFVLLSVEKCWKLWKFYYFFPLIIVSCAAWLPVSHSKKEPQNDGHRNGTQMDDHRNGIKVQ
eukprot:Em0005g1569a